MRYIILILFVFGTIAASGQRTTKTKKDIIQARDSFILQGVPIDSIVDQVANANATDGTSLMTTRAILQYIQANAGTGGGGTILWELEEFPNASGTTLTLSLIHISEPTRPY